MLKIFAVDRFHTLLGLQVVIFLYPGAGGAVQVLQFGLGQIQFLQDGVEILLEVFERAAVVDGELFDPAHLRVTGAHLVGIEQSDGGNPFFLDKAYEAEEGDAAFEGRPEILVERDSPVIGVAGKAEFESIDSQIIPIFSSNLSEKPFQIAEKDGFYTLRQFIEWFEENYGEELYNTDFKIIRWNWKNSNNKGELCG